MTTIKCLDSKVSTWWGAYNADCVDFCRQVAAARPGKTDLILYSPPFANLYVYSGSGRDMGNCADQREFFEHYNYLLPSLYAMLRPGRLCVVHCKNLPLYEGKDGVQGIIDFRGALIRAHEAAGFILRSEWTIWKCPVREREQTNSRRLTWGMMRDDSTRSGAGLAEYLLAFVRPPKEGEDEVPVSHEQDVDFSLDEWQQFASPVWVHLDPNRSAADDPTRSRWGDETFGVPVRDIDDTKVLNTRIARDDRDEQHMCPLQLPIVERVVRLYSNPGEVVFSPYMGVGSEGVGAMTARNAIGAAKPRRFFGCELNPRYFSRACIELGAVEPGTAGQQVTLFDMLDMKTAKAAVAPKKRKSMERT